MSVKRELVKLLTYDQDGVKMRLIEVFETEDGDIEAFRSNYNRIRERLEDERSPNADEQ